MRQVRTIRLNPADNVVVAIDQLTVGDSVLGIVANAKVPRGHKIATAAIAHGNPVVKYGQIIGFAETDIAPGDWVHSHNISSRDFDRDYGLDAIEPDAWPVTPLATFEGYRRDHTAGTGTRNYIGIISTVNCSASAVRLAERKIEKLGLLDDFPNVDGIVTITHQSGCGMSDHGQGFELLKRTIDGYVRHPNFGAVLMIGLGCEQFQVSRYKEEAGISESDVFRSLTIQNSGGTAKSVDALVEHVREILPTVAAAKRETRPASELMLAMQCGGSDGYSGLTANPALGAASDMLVREGGTSVLSETPEIYGAEHLLTRRATSRQVADNLIERIHWWTDYVSRHEGEMDNNPSPGNKAGGITTILEKSLGAIAKGGSARLRAVTQFAEPIKERGLIFMDAPGYDPVTATGQVAAGCNVMCFTTGRGSVFGCKPTPSLKLATNSLLYQSMQDDMDINCGDIIDGVSIEEKGKEIFEAILATASGQKTKSELLDHGAMEFVPWQLGAVM